MRVRLRNPNTGTILGWGKVVGVHHKGPPPSLPWPLFFFQRPLREEDYKKAKEFRQAACGAERQRLLRAGTKGLKLYCRGPVSENQAAQK